MTRKTTPRSQTRARRAAEKPGAARGSRAGKPRAEDSHDEATVEEFDREGLGIAAKE